MLSSWDTPKTNNEIAITLQKSSDYIYKIDKTVKMLSGELKTKDPMPFCKAVLKELGIPEFVANPLLVKSFMSHI